MNEGNAVLPRDLLRPPREWPSRRTAQNRDELPSLQPERKQFFGAGPSGWYLRRVTKSRAGGLVGKASKT